MWNKSVIIAAALVISGCQEGAEGQFFYASPYQQEIRSVYSNSERVCLAMESSDGQWAVVHGPIGAQGSKEVETVPTEDIATAAVLAKTELCPAL